MKVLWQIWTYGQGMELNSISKDAEQLAVTIEEQSSPQADIAGKVSHHDNNVIPEGEAEEIDIPDNSIFAEMVESRTVFLNENEMDIIWDNLPDNY